MKILWRSDAKCNPVGLEARLVDIDGEKTLEASFVPHLSFVQKLKAVFDIMIGRTFTVSEIYLGEIK